MGFWFIEEARHIIEIDASLSVIQGTVLAVVGGICSMSRSLETDINANCWIVNDTIHLFCIKWNHGFTGNAFLVSTTKTAE